jgi:hypothetical protein
MKTGKLSIIKKKLNLLNIEILKEINFGLLDGEKDYALQESFVLTNDIRDLLTNRHNYVLSPKGAGKSAVFKVLTKKYPLLKNYIDLNKYHFIPINKAFDTTDNKYLDKEKFKGDLGHKEYTISWSFYIALKLINDVMKNHSNKANFSAFETKIKKYGNFKEEFELYNLLDYAGNLNFALQFNVNGVDCSVKPTIAYNSPTKPLKLEEIFQLLDNFYKENDLIARVLIDRVDNFVEREEYQIQKNYLQGLVYAIEEISQLSNIQPLLFLRTDLFYSHTIKLEYDKVRERTIKLKWTQAEILAFIAYRFLWELYTSVTINFIPINLG